MGKEVIKNRQRQNLDLGAEGSPHIFQMLPLENELFQERREGKKGKCT